MNLSNFDFMGALDYLAAVYWLHGSFHSFWNTVLQYCIVLPFLVFHKIKYLKKFSEESANMSVLPCFSSPNEVFGLNRYQIILSSCGNVIVLVTCCLGIARAIFWVDILMVAKLRHNVWALLVSTDSCFPLLCFKNLSQYEIIKILAYYLQVYICTHFP